MPTILGNEVWWRRVEAHVDQLLHVAHGGVHDVLVQQEGDMKTGTLIPLHEQRVLTAQFDILVLAINKATRMQPKAALSELANRHVEEWAMSKAFAPQIFNPRWGVLAHYDGCEMGVGVVGSEQVGEQLHKVRFRCSVCAFRHF